MSSARTIIVTGANQGIGFEIVRQLAKQGDTVFLGARSAEKGKEAEAKLHAEGLKSVHFLPLDVTSQESVDNAVKIFSAASNHLDVLINNAGIGIEVGSIPAHTADVKVVKDTFETNYFGVVRVTTAFSPFILKSTNNPVILNVSSGLGSISGQTNKESPFYAIQLAGYNASKAALNMYSVALAASLPQVKVNAISPGYVATNMNGYSGVITPVQSAEGVIKYGVNLDKNGPTAQFLDYTGTTWAW